MRIPVRQRPPVSISYPLRADSEGGDVPSRLVYSLGLPWLSLVFSLTLGENRDEQEEEDWPLGVSPPTGPVRVPMCNVIDYPWGEGFSRNDLVLYYPLSLKHRSQNRPTIRTPTTSRGTQATSYLPPLVGQPLLALPTPNP